MLVAPPTKTVRLDTAAPLAHDRRVYCTSSINGNVTRLTEMDYI